MQVHSWVFENLAAACASSRRLYTLFVVLCKKLAKSPKKLEQIRPDWLGAGRTVEPLGQGVGDVSQQCHGEESRRRTRDSMAGLGKPDQTESPQVHDLLSAITYRTQNNNLCSTLPVRKDVRHAFYFVRLRQCITAPGSFRTIFPGEYRVVGLRLDRRNAFQHRRDQETKVSRGKGRNPRRYA